jgi:NAD(P)-dependent dehydrogenase (short-subunit alcohol dehydrogenase family)
MARVLITGSTDGLGRLAAQALLRDGHEIVVHGRNRDRLAAVEDLVDHGAAATVGHLADETDTRRVAEQVNALGRTDAVIHNAGVMTGPSVLAVNVIAPYLLTALVVRPGRLVYLSSNMHRGGRPRPEMLNPSGQTPTGSYSDSKLLGTTLTAAVARRWPPDVLTNAVDPGWVPTRMGGPSAPEDLRLGIVTQTWLATTDDPDGQVSGATGTISASSTRIPPSVIGRYRTSCSTSWLV